MKKLSRVLLLLGTVQVPAMAVDCAHLSVTSKESLIVDYVDCNNMENKPELKADGGAVVSFETDQNSGIRPDTGVTITWDLPGKTKNVAYVFVKQGDYLKEGLKIDCTALDLRNPESACTCNGEPCSTSFGHSKPQGKAKSK